MRPARQSPSGKAADRLQRLPDVGPLTPLPGRYELVDASGAIANVATESDDKGQRLGSTVEPFRGLTKPLSGLVNIQETILGLAARFDDRCRQARLGGCQAMEQSSDLIARQGAISAPFAMSSSVITAKPAKRQFHSHANKFAGGLVEPAPASPRAGPNARLSPGLAAFPSR